MDGGGLKAIARQCGPAQAGSRTKIVTLSDADDGEASEAHCVSQVFKEWQRVAACDGKLHRLHAR